MNEIDIEDLGSKVIEILIKEIPSSKKYKGYAAEMISDDILMLHKQGEGCYYYRLGETANEIVRRYIEDGETVFPIRLGHSDEEVKEVLRKERESIVRKSRTVQ